MVLLKHQRELYILAEIWWYIYRGAAARDEVVYAWFDAFVFWWDRQGSDVCVSIYIHATEVTAGFRSYASVFSFLSFAAIIYTSSLQMRVVWLIMRSRVSPILCGQSCSIRVTITTDDRLCCKWYSYFTTNRSLRNYEIKWPVSVRSMWFLRKLKCIYMYWFAAVSLLSVGNKVYTFWFEINMNHAICSFWCHRS